MDTVLRAAAVYTFLLILFRVTGKRSLAQITSFDLVLLLIISEATQQAMLGEDFSFTAMALVVITLAALDIGLDQLTRVLPGVGKIIDGVPLVLVEQGRPLEERLRRSRVSEDDILTAAREIHGLERMDQVKYAVLERNGGISIIPQQR